MKKRVSPGRRLRATGGKPTDSVKSSSFSTELLSGKKLSKLRIAVLAFSVFASIGLVVGFRIQRDGGDERHPGTALSLPSGLAPAGDSRERVSGGIEKRFEAWNRIVEVNFAGDASCEQCHREIYAAHQRSGHSKTLTRMTDSSLAADLLALQSYTDPQRGQTFAFSGGSDRFLVKDVNDSRVPSIPVTWLMGSGNHAQTPIAVDESTQRGVEFRWSYIRHLDALAVTPDHDRYGDYHSGTIECYGRPMEAADIRTCLGCHTTIGPPSQLPIRHDLYVPNVGCERCHGPRKQHVQMALAGRAAESPPLLSFSSAESYMANCSQCHRDENSVPPSAKPNELVRFQPYGLKRSRCYQANPEKMTCSACHDPHDSVERSRASYISQCQSCHSPQSTTQCPEAPLGDCIRCHMPAVEWTAGISFHDHWIRVPDSKSNTP